MVERAGNTKTTEAEAKIRAEFMRELQTIRGSKPVKLVNTRDSSTPPLSFHFIDDSVYREGVVPPDPEALVGCQKCRPNMGGFCGCEYTKVCECLEFAEVNVPKLTEEEAKIYEAAQANGGSTMGLPKRFPYSKGTGLLVRSYIDSGYPIYECNKNCGCGGSDEYTCKSRVVQNGRKVGFEIFKTRDRGWGKFYQTFHNVNCSNQTIGLRCSEPLKMGQFIDTYRGEIITDAEATQRGDESSKDKDSYLFGLDKFSADFGPDEKEYVIDGQNFGGPTRFINHSCDPNCGIYAVSYDKNNLFLYELAFFAVRDIRQGEELTFDYAPGNEKKDDQVEADSIPCKCGSENCRKWLWK
jgi:histone-lysine N-methyltransferase SUV39H